MIAKTLAEAFVDALTPSEALKLFPGRPSLQAMNRWFHKGVVGPDGQRLKLKSIKVAGRRYVTREAIAEFIEASNAEPTDRAHHDATSDAKAGQRAAAASVALEALGF